MSTINKIKVKYNYMPLQAKAAMWFLICSFFQKGISTITTPIFTRLLTTEEYGQYSVFNSWLGILSVFVTLNLSNGIFTQGLVKFDKERAQYASAMQGLTLFLCVGWTIIYSFSYSFWNDLLGLTTVQMLCMLCMMWTTAVFGLWASEQRVLYNYKHLVIVSLFVSILKPVIGILLVICTNDKVTARVFGIALIEVIGYTGLAIAQFRRGKTFYSKKFWKYAIVLNLPLIPHALSQHILSSADRIMIRNMEGESAAGIYSLAYNISQIMIIFNMSLSQTIAPWTYEKIKKREVDKISSIAYPTMIIIAGLNLMLIMFAPEVIFFFAPEEYYDAIYIIPPVAMSTYFMFLYDYFVRFEYYYEKTIYMMIASVVGALLNIILNNYCITRFGYVAAAYTTLVCYIIYAFAHYIIMRNICQKNLNGAIVYRSRVIVVISVGFMLSGFIILLTYNSAPIRYCIILGLMAFVLFKRKVIISLIKQLIDIRK